MDDLLKGLVAWEAGKNHRADGAPYAVHLEFDDPAQIKAWLERLLDTDAPYAAELDADE